MSARAVSWACAVPAVGPLTDRLLLLHLADRADEAGRGYVSWSEVEVLVVPRGIMVRAYLGRLVRRGFVSVRKTGDGVEFALQLAYLPVA